MCPLLSPQRPVHGETSRICVACIDEWPSRPIHSVLRSCLQAPSIKGRARTIKTLILRERSPRQAGEGRGRPPELAESSCPHHRSPVNESRVSTLNNTKETVPKTTAGKGERAWGVCGGESGSPRNCSGARRRSPCGRTPGPRPAEPLHALGSGKAPHLLQGGAALTPREVRRRPGSRRVGLARHHGAAAGPGGPARLRGPRPRPCRASADATGAAACQAASRRVRAGPSVHRGPRGAG